MVVCANIDNDRVRSTYLCLLLDSNSADSFGTIRAGSTDRIGSNIIYSLTSKLSAVAVQICNVHSCDNITQAVYTTVGQVKVHQL